MLFSIILAVINPLYSHAQASVPTLTSNKNVTVIPGSVIKGNTTGTPKALGNVSIINLPTASVSTNLANSKESPEATAGPNATALALAKAKSQTSNVTIPKKQFSLNNLPNLTSTNSTSTNSTSTHSTDPPATASSAIISNSSMPSTSLSFSLQQANKPISGFPGLNIQNGGSLHTPTGNLPIYPPDPQIAVGPKIVGEMVNVGAGFWTKDGQLIKIVPISRFFNTGTDQITDPRIMFDNSTGKWFAYLQDVSNDTVRVAVSNSSDPTTGHFFTFSFPFSGCPDQPSVGLSKDKMIISADIYSNHCDNSLGQLKGTEFTIVDKSDLLNNRNPPKTFQSKILPGLYSTHVSKINNSNETSDLYMAKVGKDGQLGGKTISVFTISGEPPNIQLQNSTLSIQQVDVPLGAAQPGMYSQPIDSYLDSRVQDSSFNQGKLWIAAEDRCTPAGDTAHNCIRLIQIDIPKNTILQDFDISQANTDLYYPALTIDSSGDLGVFFGYSSKILSVYPSLMAVGQFANGTKGILDYKVPVATGLSAFPMLRNGDYYGITIDPSKPKTFWGVGQIIPFPLSDPFGIFWNTFIANFTIPKAQK